MIIRNKELIRKISAAMCDDSEVALSSVSFHVQSMEMTHTSDGTIVAKVELVELLPFAPPLPFWKKRT